MPYLGYKIMGNYNTGAINHAMKNTNTNARINYTNMFTEAERQKIFLLLLISARLQHPLDTSKC